MTKEPQATNLPLSEGAGQENKVVTSLFVWLLAEVPKVLTFCV